MTAALDSPAEPATAPRTVVDRHRKPRRSLAHALVLLVVVLAPAVLLTVMAWRYRWTSDDGFINLRVVHQIVGGNGPVFNKGERVEAATSPLWTAILAVADLSTPFRLEWIAVVLGITASAGGLVLATLGTIRAFPRRSTFVLPLGAVVFAVIPAVWTYSTSGLDSGLGFGWIGLCWWALTTPRRRHSAARPDRPWWVPVVLGLGPLVRPDLLVVSVVFVVGHLLLRTSGGWRPRAQAVGLAVALPLVVQIFRMGYYGLLVPNTALAKEATRANWQQGWYYLSDFVGVYRLLIPLALLGVCVVVVVASSSRDERRRTAILTETPIVAGLGLGLYWVRVGGDWMHARVLLPALLCLLLPVMVVAVNRWLVIVAAGVAVWAVFCGTGFRAHRGQPHGIADDRQLLTQLSKGHGMVTIDDYRFFGVTPIAERFRDLAAGGRSGIAVVQLDRHPQLTPVKDHTEPPVTMVARRLSIGAFGYAAGNDVYVSDTVGLAEPIASHLRLHRRGRPGHEKYLPTAWVLARFARPGAPMPLDIFVIGATPRRVPAADVTAAREALRCPALVDLLDSVDAPLTPGRFLSNIVDAPRRTSLRFERNPDRAVRELCTRAR